MIESIRVVVVVPSIARRHGGPSISIRALWNAVARAGADVSVLTMDTGLTEEDTREWAGLKLETFHELCGCCRFSRALVQRATHLVEDARKSGLPVVLSVHALWQPNNHLLGSLARRSRTPMVVHPHGMLMRTPLARRCIAKTIAALAWERRNIATAAFVRVTSEIEAEDLRRLGWQCRVLVVPNGIEETPRIQDDERKTARSALGLANEDRVGVCMSRLDPIKNIDTLLRSWSESAGREGYVSKLLVCGDGDRRYRQQLEFLASTDSSVRLLGPVWGVRKRQCLAAADFFVLPSVSESFGMAAAEALAAGLPVVATTDTPWRQVASIGAGWVVAPTKEGLSRALSSAVSIDVRVLRQMGLVGRRLISSEYSWPEIGGRFLSELAGVTRDYAMGLGH